MGPVLPAPDTVPPLREGQIQVWWATPGTLPPGALALLDADELERHARLRRPEDQARFLTAAALLRTCAAGYLGCAPAEVHVARACPTCGKPHGKPTLPGSDVEVSLSHSGERVGFAAARRVPVGIDVEVQDRAHDFDALADVTLTGPERSALAALSPEARELASMTLWTRKEAVLKATGDGLRVSLLDVEVTGPLEPPRLVRWIGRPDAAARFTLWRLAPGPGHVAHLAAIDAQADGAGTPTVLELDATALLAATLTG